MKTFELLINYKHNKKEYKDILTFKTFREACKYAKEAEDLPFYDNSEIICNSLLFT